MADNTEMTTPEPAGNPTESASESLPAPVEAVATENTENGNGESAADEAQKESAMTADQALDIAFGVGVLVVEAASTLAKQLSDRLNEVQDQAPAISQALQEKGRPVREKLVSKMKASSSEPSGDNDLTAAVADAASDNESGGTIGEMVAPENILPVDPKTNGGSGSGTASSFLSNIFGLGGNKSVSAEDEINALEQRVRELEQEVTTPQQAAAAPPVTTPEVTTPEAENPFTSAPTTAEEATFTPTPPLETLEESSYAMSETDDEALAEQVEESVDQAASIDDTTAKPKVSRRKNTPAASGSEEAPESFPATEGEDRA